MNEPITVIIVDDHEIVRKGLLGYLEEQDQIEVVAQAADGETAIKITQEHAPDVVLMDLVMPGMDGVEATRRIKDISPRTKIIVLTSYHQDEYIFPALKAGAISYLLKDVTTTQLLDAILRAAAGEVTLHPRVAARVVQEVQNRTSGEMNPFTELTDREMEVLQLIARGYTNQKIAENLIISHGTVKRHVSNILNKLHLADRTQAAVFAWEQGIIRRNQS
jgi:NarL family two-component system response regulator LiaR